MDRRAGYYGRFAPHGGELKFHDVSIQDAVIASTGAVTVSLNLIQGGSTESLRIGRKCTIQSIHWRYRITLPEQDAVATPAVSESFRLIVFKDKQANGTMPAVLDLLETANMQSFRNLANEGRFVFLCDKVLSLNYNTLASDGAGVVSQGQTIKDYVWNKKVSVPIEFNGNTGAIGEIRSNNFGALFFSNGGVGGLTSQFRLRFSDR